MSEVEMNLFQRVKASPEMAQNLAWIQESNPGARIAHVTRVASLARAPDSAWERVIKLNHDSVEITHFFESSESAVGIKSTSELDGGRRE